MAISLGNVIEFSTKKPRRRRADSGIAITFPAATVEQLRECLLRLQVATELALLTLDGATTHGTTVVLSGVMAVFTALQDMPQ